MDLVNHYSENWYSLFLRPIRDSQTQSEVAFIARHLPLPRFRSIVDLCCGTGRHASPLAQHGYNVLGLDNNADAISQAKSSESEKLRFMTYDMRRFGEVPGSHDAVINLWQSFGYFDESTNCDILRQISLTLNPGGRLILDIYNRSFFEKNEGIRHFEKEGRSVSEEKRMTGNRLHVMLRYDDGTQVDSFDWELYTAPELREILSRLGFREIVTCADFNEEYSASSDKPRMQMVFEKS